MKRKRGHKKGKQKQPKIAANAGSVDVEDSSALDEFDNGQVDSRMEVEVPATLGPDQAAEVTKTDTDRFSDKPIEQLRRGRVKVKLRTSKTYSDVQAQSDIDKSNPHASVEKHKEVEKTEDSSNSLPEMQNVVSGKLPRKAGSIKIKSSRGLGSLTTILNQKSSPVQMQGERTTQTASDNDKTVDSLTSKESQQREPNLHHQDSQYNKKELNASLAVIKKVMKMDAAEPFNTPVNPVALGIPDYFDVIETPMDFGTIRNNLEHSSKYMNSEDVFKDVQYIWENCYKYNNKGDYILDLLKRVKKNFTKYWMAAGLYSDPRKRTNDAGLDHDSGVELPLEDEHGKGKFLDATGRKTNIMMSKQKNIGTTILNGSEIIQVGNVAPSSQEMLHGKGTSLKHKTRRRHGIRQHKFDCLCAVCVVRRRRQERLGKAQTVENQIEISDGNLSQEFGQEETSLENPCSEDASSNLDHSPDPDVDHDLEEQGEEVKLGKPKQQDSPQQEQEISENEMDNQKSGEDGPSEQLQLGDRSGEEPDAQFQSQEREDSVFVSQPDTPKDGTQLQQKQEASEERNRQTKMYKNLYDENPLMLELSQTIFPNDPKSVWSGPHSLAHHRPVRRSTIHAAIAMFMK